jgi:hypothetical protein
MGAGRDPVVTEISVVESNLCSTLSTGCYFDAETQRATDLNHCDGIACRIERI